MKIIYNENDIKEIVWEYTRQILNNININIKPAELKTYPTYHCEVIINGTESD